jgi:hypothetical protein
MSKKIDDLIAGLNGIIYRDSYKVEIDTQDMVFGFRKTLTKRTKNKAKAYQLQAKTSADVGRFLSPSVRVMEVRWYRNGELIKTLKALPLN